MYCSFIDAIEINKRGWDQPVYGVVATTLGAGRLLALSREQMENPGWGYDRIVGALANVGHEVADQTVGNVLKRHSQLRPKRKFFERFLV